MATIKAIQSNSVHQIQSGQVITDLCSVAKELVENSLDAGATSIALKHYTSKLSSYDDLTSLETFGFRGEALSSLCALSELHIITARSDSGAKGSRLDFEPSGKLKGVSVTAAPRGTTVVVGNLFHSLPVRQKELVRHIKREYAKVLGILQAYACIGEGVRFSVSNQMPKGTRSVVFTTKANPTTRENIANVFGAKTMAALIALDLNLELKPTQKLSVAPTDFSRQHEISIRGHMSKPNFGEGRQAPDRQMFFVNSRPCGLPQIAKAFNEVYRTYNVTQSPFVFANLIIDTNAYDVNVSPDKRTILLHDQPALLEALKDALAQMFESYAPSVPVTQIVNGKLPSYTPLTSSRANTTTIDDDEQGVSSPPPLESSPDAFPPVLRLTRSRTPNRTMESIIENDTSIEERRTERHSSPIRNDRDSSIEVADNIDPKVDLAQSSPVDEIDSIGPIGSQKGVSGPVLTAFDRMRARKQTPEVAEIRIGNNAATKVVAGNLQTVRSRPSRKDQAAPTSRFTSILQGFAASGTRHSARGSTDNDGVNRPVLEEQDQPDDVYGASLEPERNSASSLAGSRDSLEPPADEDNGINDVLLQTPPEAMPEDASSDSEYVDEEAKRIEEDRKVAEMIQEAEDRSVRASEDNLRRAERVMKARHGRQGTVNLVQVLPASTKGIEEEQHKLAVLERQADDATKLAVRMQLDVGLESTDAETKLSLSICKADFLRMRIIGQFNLGFILAYRRASKNDEVDQIFVIDQHAADEKFNFERLSQTTTLAPQRLVQAKTLELSAQDEEILLSNTVALERNGFQVDIDESGEVPTGQRCKLLSLPTSKETTFGVSDLEELIHLLSESIGTMSMDMDGADNQQYIPRPSRVRRMLAMRACRSSIMVGKNLTHKQMTEVVRHMARMEKPWNCPHGRPTLRHLAGLDSWNAWREGEKYWVEQGARTGTDWAGYLTGRQSQSSDEE